MVTNEIPVLLVEDNKIVQTVQKNILSDAGFSVDTADCGKEALDQFAKKTYTAIFMDLGLPDFSGVEATLRIRETEKNKQLPETLIIAVTSHPRNEMKATCEKAGFNDYIEKPLKDGIVDELKQHYYQRLTRRFEK